MYAKHFGFSCRPFSLTPDPEFLFWTEQHRRAFDLLCMSLVQAAPISLVTGDIGSGKTTLVQALLREIPADIDVGLLSNVVGDSGDLLRWTLSAFGRDAGPGSRLDAQREIAALLRARDARGRRSVLVIDEAQNVSDAGIETLRLLTNIEIDGRVPLSLVLVGQPELRERLTRPAFAALRQRLGVAVHLGPMTPAQTLGYVRRRIEIAGGDPGVFEAGAVAAVHRRAGGVPRLVNLLADLCCMGAFAEGRSVVDAAFAEQMLAESLAFGTIGGLVADAADVAVASRLRDVRVAQAGARRQHSGGSAGAEAPAPARPALRVVEAAPPADATAAPPDEKVAAAPPATPPAALPRATARRRVDFSGALGAATGFAVAASLGALAVLLPASVPEREPAAAAAPTLDVAGRAPFTPHDRMLDAATAPTSGTGVASAAAFVPAAAGAEAPVETAAALYRQALALADTDPAAAADAYARAAARGHRRSAYYLGQMYETGDGVPRVADTARAWYAVAAEEIASAQARLDGLGAVAAGGTAAAPVVRYGARDATGLDMVWTGRGPFVVEVAPHPGAEATTRMRTPLTALRLDTPDDAGWWRVASEGGAPTEWQPVAGGAPLFSSAADVR